MDLLSEINDLIHLKVEKAKKNHFKSALQELQKRDIKVKHDHIWSNRNIDAVCVCVQKIYLSKKTEQYIKFIPKLKKKLKEACPNLSSD